MAAIRLKPGRDKALRNRHPWIFSGAIAATSSRPEPGEIVDVHSHDGAWLARGYYNPRSQITVRALTWEAGEPIDESFWERRVQAAIARRESLAREPGTTCYRLVFAESDGLPGLIVDRYGDWLVLQALTLGIERRKQAIADTLMQALAPAGIYERSDVDVRGHEGLGQTHGVLRGAPPPATVEVLESGLRFGVDLARGHKTGFYLDQRENRALVAPHCRGADVLNVFSYTGGFGVYAAAQSAQTITSLDSSADALAGARDNLARNGFSRDQDLYLEGDAFAVLRELAQEGRSYDLVILDPPKFAFSRGQVERATRGYKDINMLGMRLLRPGGALCTFSCSGLVSADLFQKVLFGASVDVGREARIIGQMSQASDHPVLLTFPESAYLKGLILRIE